MEQIITSNYTIGNVSCDADSFFSSVGQGLEQFKGGKFCVKMLRQECKKYALNCSALVDTIGGDKIHDYIAQIEYCENECQSPIWGRPEVEGRIINKVFKVNIYVIEEQCSDSSGGTQESRLLYKIIDESGYRLVEEMDFEAAETVYIIKEGNLNFQPIVKINLEKYSDNDSGDCIEKENDDDENSENEIYEIREGTSGAGGHFYEIKLLILLLQRLQITDKFYLAKNMANVGAFDDVVFKYHIKNNDGLRETKTVFLQAKHSDASETGNITLDSLLSAKGAFSLKKYFKSYREIERNFQTVKSPIFKGNFADSNFVIFTNYVLEKPRTNNQMAERWRKRWTDKKADGFLIAKGERSHQLTVDKDINGDIIEKLACSPLGQLAQEIYDYVFGKKKDTGIRIENEIFQEYHICLANEVFTVNRNKPSDSKLSSTFLDGNRLWNELYQIADRTQGISKDEFQIKLNAAKVNLFKTFGNFQLSLERKTFNNLATELANIIGQSDSDFIKINNPPSGIVQLANNVLVRDDAPDFAVERVKFGNLENLKGQAKEFMTMLKEKLAENVGCKDIKLANIRFEIDGLPRFSLPGPDEDVTESEVKRFLTKLEFAIGQKNENDLDDVIKKEIGETHKVKQEVVDLIYQSVKSQVETWWKTGNYFLTRGNKFVENARVSIAHFKLSPFGNKTGIEETAVSFKATVVNEFNGLIGQKQVLNIVADEGTTVLSKVKVCQTLNQYSAQNGYIFVQMNHLVYISDHVLQIFERDHTRNVLVTENNSSYQKDITWHENDFSKLYDKLHEIIMKDKRKKIVLVTEKDDMLANYFTNDAENFHKVLDNINFNHLTVESQKRLMDNEVMLHGKPIKMRDLIDIENQNAMSVITSQTIMSLMKNDNLIISNAPQRLCDLEAAYTKLYETMPMENLVRELRTSAGKNMIYVISGLKQPRSGTIHDELINLLQITDPYLERELRERICLYGERNNNKPIIVIENTKQTDILIEFRQICSNKSDNIIYLMAITGEEAQIQQVYKPDYYIKRCFHYVEKIVLNVESILKQSTVELFIFNDKADREGMEKCIQYLPSECQKRFQKMCENKSIIFANSELDAQLLFNSNTAVNKTTSAHWVQMLGSENQQLVWKKSHGSLHQLRHCIDKQKMETKYYTEEEFNIKIKDKVVIIADEPGMGKSTSLTSVSQQMLDENWVIRINFLDCKDAIEILPEKDLNYEDVYNFVAKVDEVGLRNDLAKQLMLYKLDPKECHCRSILLMFDGYDEISSAEQTKIIRLLHFVKWQTSAKLWVTTRLHEMHALENSLSTFATKFKPLVLEDQKEFLNMFWKVRLAPLLKLENNDERIEKYSSKFLGESKDIFSRPIPYSQIMGVPLQLQLIAEVLTCEIVSYLNGCDDQHPNFDHLNVLNLYQSFIDAKYEIYVREKIRLRELPPSLKSVLYISFDKQHETLALHLLFPEDDCLLLYPKTIVNQARDDFNSVGIIQSIGREGKPYFIHRTFAEYFVAKFLVRNLKKGNPKKYEWTVSFLSKHMVEENQVINKFIDHMLLDFNFLYHKLFFEKKLLAQLLSASFQIFFTTLANKLRDVIELSKDKTEIITVDNLDRTALHLAARDGRLNIVKVLLDNGYHADISDALGKTPLHYATMNKHKEVVEHLLNYTADIEIGDNVFATPLHADMEIGNNLFREDHSKSLLLTLVNRNDIEGKTAFNYATENNDWTIACSLVLHGAHISFGNEDQLNHIATHVLENITNRLHNPYFQVINYQYFDPKYIRILGLLWINNLPADYFYRLHYIQVEILHKFYCAYHMKVIDAIAQNMTSPICFKLLQSLASYKETTVNCSDEDNLKVAKYIFGKSNDNFLLRKLGLNTARNGNLETLKYILEHEKAKDVCKYMFDAIKCGKQNIVKYLFENYSDDITKDELNDSLYHAVSNMKLGIVTFLIENGADVNARNNYGKTLIHSAAEECSTLVMPYLLQKGAGSTISELEHPISCFTEICRDPFKQSITALDEVINNLRHIAEGFPHLSGLTEPEKVAVVIISYVKNDANCRNDHGTTLLHIAASFQMPAFVYYLIKHGVNVNIKDGEGRTPLHKAVQTHCVRDKNVDDNDEDSDTDGDQDSDYDRDKDRDKDNEKIIMLLLEHGAIYDAKDENNATVLDYFSQSETSNGYVYELLNLIDQLFTNFNNYFEELMKPKMNYEDQKVIYGTKNSSGNTLLHLSADSGNVELVRKIFKHGCPFNSRNNENNTPKDLAQKNNHKNVVEFILSIENAFSAIQDSKEFEIERIFEDYPNATDENGKTMLHWSAANGNVGITELLIKKDREIDDNINKDDYSGWTPLHYAAKHDKLEIVSLLMYHGAEFNPINRDRKSPLQVATGKSLNLLQYINHIYNAIQIESHEIANQCLKSMKRNNYKAFVAAINCVNFEIKLLRNVIEANDLELTLFLLQNGAGYDISHDLGKFDKEISNLLRFIDQLFKWERQLIYSHNTIENCPIKLKVIRKCRDRIGNTILHKAARYPINYCRLKFLIKHGADVNAINKKGETVLDWAIRRHNLDLVKFLLKNNANIKKLAPDYKRKLIKLADNEERPDIVDLISSLEKCL